jgi:plasmid rolling circle replication initiator protein Rep
VTTSKANHNSATRASGSSESAGPKTPLPYRDRLRVFKLRTQSVAGAAYSLGPDWHKTAGRFAGCCNVVRLNEWHHQETGEVLNSWGGALTCKQRGCPNCQHLKSRILCQQVGKVYATHMERRPTDKALLLTLTVKNCDGERLRPTLQALHHAFGKLRRRIEFEGAVTAYFRSTEVTVNKTAENHYHPHMHVLLMVPAAYFKKSAGLYITHEVWGRMWQECLGTDYIPHVGITAVTEEALKEREDRYGRELTLSGAISEVAKYCVKPDGYQELTKNGKFFTDPEVFKNLYTGMKSLRLYSWGGCFDEIRKELALPDVEGSDIDIDAEIEKEERPKQNVILAWRVVYVWDSDARGGWGEFVEQNRCRPADDPSLPDWLRDKGGG